MPSAFQTTFGKESNQGVAPKQMDQLPNLKLNDGNEIPVASPPFSNFKHI